MRFVKRLIAIILLVVVVVFGILFSIQNNATAPLDLLLIQLPEQKISLWVLLAFMVGGLIGVLTSTATIVRLKSQTLLLQRKVDKQTDEHSKHSISEIMIPIGK